MKIAKDFDLREFVPPKIWAQYGERSAQFLDPRVCRFTGQDDLLIVKP